jgi:hypothetical protein
VELCKKRRRETIRESSGIQVVLRERDAPGRSQGLSLFQPGSLTVVNRLKAGKRGRLTAGVRGRLTAGEGGRLTAGEGSRLTAGAEGGLTVVNRLKAWKGGRLTA